MLCPDCGADAPMAGARLTPDGPEYLYNCPNGHPVVGDFLSPPQGIGAPDATIRGAAPSPLPPSDPGDGAAGPPSRATEPRGDIV